MPTTNNRLGLRVPVGSDPFKRDDFVYNYNTLISYPGYYPCTSTTRPVWAAAQAGMLILETDTSRVLRWTGSAWAALNQYTATAFGSVRPNVMLASGYAGTYDLATVTLPRACRVNMIGSARFYKWASTSKGVTPAMWIDGTNAEYGFTAETMFADYGTSSSTGSQTVPMIGTRSLSAGAHTLQARIEVADTPGGINFEGVKMIAFFSEA